MQRSPSIKSSLSKQPRCTPSVPSTPCLQPLTGIPLHHLPPRHSCKRQHCNRKTMRFISKLFFSKSRGGGVSIAEVYLPSYCHFNATRGTAQCFDKPPHPLPTPIAYLFNPIDVVTLGGGADKKIVVDCDPKCNTKFTAYSI